MRTIKPLRLGVLTRPYGYRQHTRLGVLVYSLIDFTTDDPKLVPEAELSTRLIHQMDCDGILDLVLPKVHPEFLVSGSAYTAHQPDKTRCAVRIQVGGLDKSLIAWGDRYWLGGVSTEPQPFEQMPVTWANAFGGREFDENPAGKGLDQELVNGVWTTRLPNIEALSERVHTPGQLTRPAGLSPIFLTRPRRYGHIGNVSDNWLKNDITSFFPDMDPRLFNAAEEDQRWRDRDSLPLGVPFSIWNMHPDQPCWSGVIPDWVPRCFVMQRNEAHVDDFLEVDLKPTTIWFIPGIKHAVMMYHGSIPVNRTYAEDVSAIIPAMELKGEHRPAADYRRIFDQRNSMETGALYALRDKDLVPKSIMGDWLDTKPLAENALMRNTRKQETIRRAEIREKIEKENKSLPQESRLQITDVMPEIMGPPFPQSVEYFPELHERMLKIKQDTEAQMAQEQASARKKAQEQMPDTDDPKLQETVDLLAKDPEPPTRKQLRQAMSELDKQQQKMEQDWEKIQTLHTNSGQAQEIQKLGSLLKDAKIQLGKMNLYTAHFMEGETIVDKHAADKKRDWILARCRNAHPLNGLDLAGANLSDTMFSDIDFSGCDLSDADLDHAHFIRCNLSESILVRARISHTTFDECQFTRTNLGATHIRQSNFSRSHFDNITLHKSELTQCDLRHSRWSNTLFNAHARFTQCRFDNAMLEKTIFTECVFEDVSFHSSQFSQVVFQQSTLNNLNFEKTNISSAGFVASQLQKMNFAHARLEGVSFMYKLSLETCSFDNATLQGCCFKETAVKNLTMRGSRLSHCDFSGARIPYTDFTDANLHQCVLKGSDLRHCLLRRADLTSSIFQQADLRGADISHANFCTADLSETQMDESTQIHHVYVKHAKIYPLQKNASVSWGKFL